MMLPMQANEASELKQPPVAAGEKVVPVEAQSDKNMVDSGNSSIRKLLSLPISWMSKECATVFAEVCICLPCKLRLIESLRYPEFLRRKNYTSTMFRKCHV